MAGAVWSAMSLSQWIIFSVGAMAVPVGVAVAVTESMPGGRGVVAGSQAPGPFVTYGTNPWRQDWDSSGSNVLPEKAEYTSALKVAMQRLDQALTEVGAGANPPPETSTLGDAPAVREAFVGLKRAVEALPPSSPPPASKAETDRVDRAMSALETALRAGAWFADQKISDAFKQVWSELYTLTPPDPPQPTPTPDPNQLDTVNAFVGLFGAGLGAASAAMTLRAARSQPTSGRGGVPRPRRLVAGRRDPP